jgi:hypothetical protein
MKRESEEKEKQAIIDAASKKGQKVPFGLSGRDLFAFDPTLFVDDDGAADQQLYNDIQDPNNVFDEELFDDDVDFDEDDEMGEDDEEDEEDGDEEDQDEEDEDEEGEESRVPAQHAPQVASQ